MGYNTYEMGKKGLEWNQTQLKTAKMLGEKMTPKEIGLVKGFSEPVAWKVFKHIHHGDPAPSLDEAFIAAAKIATTFEEHQKKHEKDDKLTPANLGSDGGKSQKAIVSGIVKLAPFVITCQYTPIMYIARQAATERWGWNPDIAFEDFCDTIFYHFFKDRGITLQGYIVDEEVEAKL